MLFIQCISSNWCANVDWYLPVVHYFIHYVCRFSATHRASYFCTTRPRTLIRRRRPWCPAHVAPLWQTVRCIYYQSVKRTAFPCHRFHHWRMYPRSNCHQPSEVCHVLQRQKIERYRLQYTTGTYWNSYHCWNKLSPSLLHIE